MRKTRRTVLSATCWMAALALPVSAPLAATVRHDGKVGLTSYRAPPFQSQVYALCWGCTNGMEPAQLFYQANPSSQFYNSSLMAQVRQLSAGMTAKGVVPTAGAQRWEDTWEASQAASLFPGEPSWIANDRYNNGNPLTSQPEFVAWSGFITARSQLWDTAFDGGTMPNQANYFRSWHSQWGFVSPLTPLDQADCPPDMSNGCTWGDDWAYRWALTTALTGGYGVSLSDFTDSQPAYPSYLHDFNPRILSGFAAAYGYQGALNGLSPSQAANWIMANAFSEWNDNLSVGYGRYYNALATRVGKAASHAALVIDQCSVTPSFRRFAGTDQRLITQNMSSDLYICNWDNQSIQVGRSGPIASPPAQELAGAVVAAARTPWVRNAANMEADDNAYWNAIASFYPTLSGTDQKEIGYKLLKRIWFWEAWAHIATEHGHIRRALAMWARDYFDMGTLTALNPMTTLIQGIVPRAPIGPALYYSVPVERAIEGTEPQRGQALQPYLLSQVLEPFIDAGGGLGYYVSDTALPSIKAGTDNAPSAWVVLDTRGLMSQSELNALQAIAPVVSTPQQLAALPNQPFVMSGGITGFAFRDEWNRVIIVLTNPSTLPTAGSVNGTATLSLPAGTYEVRELMSGGKPQKVTDTNGQLVIQAPLGRWDTEVFAISTK